MQGDFTRYWSNIGNERIESLTNLVKSLPPSNKTGGEDMVSVNLFDPKQYKLSVRCFRHFNDSYKLQPEWIFMCEIAGMKLKSERTYTTDKGAWRAGYNWLEKYVFKKI